MLQAQRSVLCMEAFAECNIPPDPVVILSSIRLAKCRAKKQDFTILRLIHDFRHCENCDAKVQYSYLVASENAETVDDLFRSVSIGGLACHEVEEGIKVHIA